MPVLDKYNRVTIPKNLIDIAQTDFSKEVGVFLKGNEFFLDNISSNHPYCLGSIQIDSQHRFYIPQTLRNILNLKPKTNLLCFIYENKITFRRFTFIPENR